MFSYITELAHATRTLFKTRAFTAVCVISLGVGMGVVIGILLLSRFVFATPPLVLADGLVEVVIRPTGALRAQAGTDIIDTWSFPDYLDMRDASSGLAVTGWTPGDGQVRLADKSGVRSVPTLYVSSNYFSTLGVTLTRGRGFTQVDDASRAEAEAVISYRTWHLLFAGDPNIVGQTVTINESTYVVAGVTPEAFRGHVGGLNAAHYGLWLPLSHHPRLTATDTVRLSRDARWLRVLARLSPSLTLTQADAMVHSAMTALAARYPASNQDKVGGAEAYFPPGARLRAQVGYARMMMLAIAGLVLLVVGLNISGMMLVRSAMRARELAIRQAIGASRWRLMRYHLTEALVLAVFGGALASSLLFGVPILVAWAADISGPALDLFRLDVWLVLQCIALCFVTSLVLGLLPALRFSRPAILSALKNDAGGGRRVGWLQRLTAAAQAGLAVPFLVIGGVKLDQARVTLMADFGFKPQGLYAVQLNLAAIGTTDNERARFVRKVEEHLAQAPGVQSVSVADGVPLDSIYRNTRIGRDGGSTFLTVHTTRVSDGYFDTLGIRLLTGRAIGDNDSVVAERVVMLSEPLARDLFPSNDALGGRVAFALAGNEPQTYTVVGVTTDVVSTQMGNPRPQLFVSLAQHPASSVLVIARGASSDPSMRVAFEHALKQADPELVLRELITGEGLVQNNHADLLTHSAVGSALAGVALILAALGVYGVIAFMVATRTREIGVRVALGASRTRVVRDVLGDALQLVIPGIGLGLVVAIFWVRVADPSWYPLGGVEPLVYTLAAMTAFAVAALAGIPSARRAAAVQPIIAMRAE